MSLDTPISITGPLRSPRRMLADQSYGGHASVHDEGTTETPVAPVLLHSGVFKDSYPGYPSDS